VSVTIISGISTVAAAVVAGWFAFLARRSQAQGPESVAGGYSRLVADMRVVQEQLRQQVAGLDADVKALSEQVGWLIPRLPADLRKAFYERFGEPGDPGGAGPR